MGPLAALLLLAPTAARAETVPFEPRRWQIEAQESSFIDHQGRQSLHLKGGIATVVGSKHADGVIEFDLSFTGERGFTGAAWRIQGSESYEELYVRPHQSGNPDADQYQPVFNGIAAWQLYHGERYSAPVKYRFNARRVRAHQKPTEKPPLP
jgi:hypothetical protein